MNKYLMTTLRDNHDRELPEQQILVLLLCDVLATSCKRDRAPKIGNFSFEAGREQKNITAFYIVVNNVGILGMSNTKETDD